MVAEEERQLSALYLLGSGKPKKISLFLFFHAEEERRDLGDKGNRTCFCGVSHPLLG